MHHLSSLLTVQVALSEESVSSSVFAFRSEETRVHRGNPREARAGWPITHNKFISIICVGT